MTSGTVSSWLLLVSLCCSKVFWATLRSSKSTADEWGGRDIEGEKQRGKWKKGTKKHRTISNLSSLLTELSAAALIFSTNVKISEKDKELKMAQATYRRTSKLQTWLIFDQNRFIKKKISAGVGQNYRQKIDGSIEEKCELKKDKRGTEMKWIRQSSLSGVLALEWQKQKCNHIFYIEFQLCLHHTVPFTYASEAQERWQKRRKIERKRIIE